jgi:signal peptidase II
MAELPRPPPPSRAARALLAALAAGLVGCDHATKHAAEATLGGGASVPVVDGVLELRLALNLDTAFGLLSRVGIPPSPGLLAALAALGLAALVAMWLARRKEAPPVEHLGYVLVSAGAVGNVLDRLVRGYVVDFIHVTSWPVFNVADVAVVIGFGLVLLARARAGPSAAPTALPGTLASGRHRSRSDA